MKPSATLLATKSLDSGGPALVSSACSNYRRRKQNANGLILPGCLATLRAKMVLPSHPVTLSPEQLAELNQRLSDMRHDINNYLSLVIAASELIRQKPQLADRMLGTLAEQPPKITQAMLKFSGEFERMLGITKG